MLAFSRGMMGLRSFLLWMNPPWDWPPNIVDNIFSIAKEVAQESGLTIILVEQDVREGAEDCQQGIRD